MEFVSVAVVACYLVALQQLATATQYRADDYDPSELARAKRTLVYPKPSTLLLIFGLGTPLQLDRESVIVGAFAKMIYALPTNSTELTEVSAAASSRSRWSLYRSLARLATLYGFGEGKACVLRSVCEAAAAPFDARQGLLHQLLQTFLAPSSSRDEYDEYQDREYHAAERLGSKDSRDACHALYPECRASLLDVFSSAAHHPRSR